MNREVRAARCPEPMASAASHKPLRLLVITEHYWPETFRITDVVEGLRERGHHVEVLTAMPNYPQGKYFDGYSAWGPWRENHAGIPVRRVPVIARGRGQGWRLVLNYASYAAAATARIPFIGRRWDASLVFQPSPVTTCVPALALRATAGVPVAMWVQDLWPESISATGVVRAPWIIKCASSLSAWLYRNCDRVLGQSRAFLPRLERAGVPPDRLEYLPNWAEDLYGAATPQPLEASWTKGFPIVFAGNLGRVQALDTVLKAAQLLRDDPEVRWVFVGDGPLKQWLEREAGLLGLGERVVLLDRRPVEEMPRYFASAGAMLVSLKANEVMALTIPSKIQSYLAAARPVLGAIDGEGARVIEESGAGWAAPAGDAEALARNVLRMKALSNSERAAMGRRGRAYYEREFDRSLCLGRLERILLDLANGASE